MELVKKRFNLDDYYLMHECGVLTEDERVELIDGEIIKMSPIGRYHVAYVNRLNSLFGELLGRLVIVSVQNPVILSNLSQPQPDIALLKPRRDFYISGIAQVLDVFLLVEVADTTLEYDRDVKIPIYATYNVPEVWLVNVLEQVIVVYSQPGRNSYTNVKTFQSGDDLSLTAFPTINFPVNEILVMEK